MKSKLKVLVPCSKCQKLVRKASLKRHLKMHEEPEEHRCEICLKVYKNRMTVMQHKYEIHPKFPRLTHPCQNCGKKFTKQSNMKTHEEYHCPQGVRRRVTCHLCGILVVPYKYNIHIRVCSGTGMKDFPCYFCHNRFSTKYLLSHYRIHSKEKPYSCKHCPYKFAHSVNVRRHELRMHGKGSKQYLYICYFCKKNYIKRDSLHDHIKRYHVKEKGYQYLRCPRRFSTLNLLNSHTRRGGRTDEDKKQHGVHRSLRCFCYFCGKGLETNKSLSIHMLKYHLKEVYSYRTHMINDVCNN